MTITFTRLVDPDHPDREKLRIEGAGPREFIHADLMRQILHGTPWAERQGGVLTLHDDFDHRYVYLVGDYDYQRNGYELRADVVPSITGIDRARAEELFYEAYACAAQDEGSLDKDTVIKLIAFALTEARRSGTN